MMAFSDFPPPDHFPVYMHHSKVLEYLQYYVDKFDLEKNIQFGTKILSIEHAEDYEETGRWKLTISLKRLQNKTRLF